jgi:hydrocephalus-inducing protein
MAGASVLQKGEHKEILITFTPKDLIKYMDVIPFEINGLYTVPITITGEGSVPRIELVNSSQKALNFGVIRVGEVARKTVKIICKSKVPTPISFTNSLTPKLRAAFISIGTSKGTHTVKPKGTCVGLMNLCLGVTLGLHY